jgi:hypothetical protein
MFASAIPESPDNSESEMSLSSSCSSPGLEILSPGTPGIFSAQWTSIDQKRRQEQLTAKIRKFTLDKDILIEAEIGTYSQSGATVFAKTDNEVPTISPPKPFLFRSNTINLNSSPERNYGLDNQLPTLRREGDSVRIKRRPTPINC